MYPANFRFPELTVRIPGLQIWLSRRIIQEFWQKDEATGRTTQMYRVLHPADEVTRVPAINATLVWGVSSQAKVDTFGSISGSHGWMGRSSPRHATASGLVFRAITQSDGAFDLSCRRADAARSYSVPGRQLSP